MNTFLLSLLTSIGKIGFHALLVTSLTKFKLMGLSVMSFATRMRLVWLLRSWFGGSSTLISWHEHFSARVMSLDTSIEGRDVWVGLQRFVCIFSLVGERVIEKTEGNK